MRVSWVLFVASRYFRARRQSRGAATSVLAVAGIAVGVMALNTVLGVMNGFQLDTIEAILEINSYHLRVRPAVEADPDGAGQADMERFGDSGRDAVNRRPFVGADGRLGGPGVADRAAPVVDAVIDTPGVLSVVPFLDVQGIGRGLFSSSQVLYIRGLPDDAPELDPGFGSQVRMTHGAFDLSGPESMVIGSELARSLGAQVGSIVQIVNLSGPELNALRPQEEQFVVTGVFQSEFFEYDRSWAFVSLDKATAMAGNADDIVLGLKLEDRFADRRIAAALQQDLREAGLNAEVESWRLFNRSIFGALQLEKTLMMVLLGLIFIVVGVSIYQTLRRTVLERREEIALLKALGATPSGVRAVFAFDGVLIGVAGATIGTLLGLMLAYNINEVFAFVEIVASAVASVLDTKSQVSFFSADYFYISEVPSSVLLLETMLIFVFACVSATAAAYLAGRRATAIRPSQVLRYE